MIEGHYILITGEENGLTIPEEVCQASNLLIEQDRHEVRVGDQTMIGSHTLDTDASPMTINVIDDQGPFAGEPLRGIFKLDGNQFIVCFSGPGGERPTEFTTADGQALLLHTWERQN